MDRRGELAQTCGGELQDWIGTRTELAWHGMILTHDTPHTTHTTVTRRDQVRESQGQGLDSNAIVAIEGGKFLS